MPSIQRLLDQRVTAAMRAAYPEVPDAPAIVVIAADSRFGDYQANGAMALAKRLKIKPREVAEKIIANLDLTDHGAGPAEPPIDICDTPEIAGPGFINLRLRAEWLSRHVGLINPPGPAPAAVGAIEPAADLSRRSEAKPEAADDDRLGVERVAKSETIVVDYSAPNLAKEMHVGHLRSTIIGDALARILDFAGHKVVRQNHVGDWGTQVGMLLAYIQRSDDIAVPMYQLLTDLEENYRSAKALYDSDTAFAKESREAVVRLQCGDPHELIRWGGWRNVSLFHSYQVYQRLGALLTEDNIRGESAYEGLLAKVIGNLQAKGLLVESEGAQCVFLNDAEGQPMFVAKDGNPLPLIVKKSDDGYLYATTDLAAIGFRTGFFAELPAGPKSQRAVSPHAARILYVVDARQALHFKMVFETARRAGFAKPDTPQEKGTVLEHIAFGTMMGPDGRPFKTREGGTVKLMDLLQEAERRALDLVSAKNAADVAEDRAKPLAPDQMKEIARKIGIGAVKYADLAQNRTSDYVFSWEKMLALDGNTAPYMQYAYARVRSIFRKAWTEAGSPDRGDSEAAIAAKEDELHRDAAPIPLAGPQEVALARKVLQFAEIIDRTLDDYRPNILAAYLYDLAGAFTAFYDACPVIQSKDPTRTARLKLCDLTARVMRRGLGLLGIETAERM